ncbi:MAG: hypothetical protein LBT96_04995 [Campylobacteraceae bacterium]|jgi:hypothetical protein|nr:hypothetical protein [Campylobacteraceae bacterium]
MSALNIVHIAPTPLVGSPGKIAFTQRLKGHNAIAIALSDYPKGGPLENKFLENTLMITSFTRRYINECISVADVIHIHNYLSNDKYIWLQELNQKATFAYQVHSPQREGPLYVLRAEKSSPINYDVKFVVGQHGGRFYPDYIAAPNLILSPPSIHLRKKGEKLRVMFSPTQKQIGRWTSKYSAALEEALAALSKANKIELIYPEQPVHPNVLMWMRRNCHVTIDEIATGGFHMVSLEGLCAGNIVINRADYFAKATFANFCKNSMPPFVYANDDNIFDVLLELSNDEGKTAKLQKDSFSYFKDFCNPLELVEIYNKAYKNVR